MRGQPGIADLDAQLLKMGGDCHGPTAMFAHADGQMGQALDNIEGRTRVHGGPQQHDPARVQVLESVDKIFAGAYGPGYQVAGAIDEFGQGIDHHMGAQAGRGHQYGGEGIVHHQGELFALSQSGQFGDIGYF